jgi:hypothetical protein
MIKVRIAQMVIPHVLFWLVEELQTRHAIGYLTTQLAGPMAGAIPLQLWGTTGRVAGE